MNEKLETLSPSNRLYRHGDWRREWVVGGSSGEWRGRSRVRVWLARRGTQDARRESAPSTKSSYASKVEEPSYIRRW